MNPRLLPYGERAVLLEVASIEQVLGVYAAVQSAQREGRLTGVEDVVPAAVTVLISFADTAAMRHALPTLRALDSAPSPESSGELMTIEVSYDGEDLDAVAELTGLSRHEVVELHSSTDYSVAFSGFSPGFAYLIGLDERLRVPRRPTPRTRVPAGSVAMTGGFTAVYPRQSPGGWQLLGHTDAAMWDGNRPDPALLRPGMRVRFVPS